MSGERVEVWQPGPGRRYVRKGDRVKVAGKPGARYTFHAAEVDAAGRAVGIIVHGGKPNREAWHTFAPDRVTRDGAGERAGSGS